MSKPEIRAQDARPTAQRLWRQVGAIGRPLPLFAALCFWLHEYDTAPEAARREADPARSLATALAKVGLQSHASEIRFLPDVTPRWAVTRHERAIAIARRPGELPDAYLVFSRRSPEGVLLEISSTHNLTETSAASETDLVVHGTRGAWAISNEKLVHAVQLIEFAGEPPLSGAEWTPARKVQNAITNLQETGQLRGIGRRWFKLDPPAGRVTLALTRDSLLVDSDAHRVRVPTSGSLAAEVPGDRFAVEQTPKKGRPGNFVTWAVDRARALPWFGDRYMQIVKAVAFEAGDQLDQIVSTVSSRDGSEAVKEELGALYAAPQSEVTNPETGWPPPPMIPMLNPPLKGEGKWVEFDSDVFVGRNPGSPPPFVMSFIRTDKKRIYSQVFVTVWDPRQVELHPVSGTVEPKSATGETGTGEVPRKPEIMGRLVGALNGGFQAMHGEFGMMADRTVYLPPRPYGATVALLDDGSTGFGTWPEDASGPIPQEIVSFRQNMTPLVVDEQPNPYKRHWWGGVPPGWTQETRTVRSAICMTRENFVAYFYGAGVDPDVLALSMVRARCIHGIHLDMNAGHTGLEFYRAAPKGKLPKLTRRLDDMWEARGPVPGMNGWEFLGRRMIRLMALMNFPRYIGTEQRDFFYLLLRPTLPGEPVATPVQPALPGEGAWRTEGLLQRGWPPAVATTRLRPDSTRPQTSVALVKLDPRLLRGLRAGEPASMRVVEFRTPAARNDMSFGLWHGPHAGFVIAKDSPEPAATRLSLGYTADERQSIASSAAVGVDPSGMLVYASVTEGGNPASDGSLLRSLLTSMGCTNALYFPNPLGAELAEPGDTPASAANPAAGVVLVRTEGPGARRIFQDTPIVGPKRWAPIQTRRTGASPP